MSTDPQSELDDLHGREILTDAEFQDAETRVPEVAPAATEPAQDTASTTDATTEPPTSTTSEAAAPEPVDETGAAVALTPAEQELAAVGTLGPTEQHADPSTLDQIAAYWEQTGPWAPAPKEASDVAAAS